MTTRGPVLVAWLVAAGLTLSGCGESASPAAQVPELTTALERVDDAVASRNYEAAHDALDELVDTATTAGDAGELDAEQAQGIVDAAEELRAALPAQAPTQTPTEEPTEEVTPQESPTPDEADEGEDEDDKNDKGKGKGKSKGH